MLCLSENPVDNLNWQWQTLSVNGETANILDSPDPRDIIKKNYVNT